MSETETTPSMADASASAMERVDAAMGSTPPETTQPTTPETTPGEVTPEAAPEAWKAPEVWEEEFDGQRYRLTPNEVSFVLQQYHKAIRKAQEAGGQKAPESAAAPEGAAPRGGEDPRIAKLEQAVQSLLKIHEERDFNERKSTVEREAQTAMEKDPVLKGLKSEKLKTRMRNLVLLEHLYNPGLSFSDAAKRVASDYEEERRQERGSYVQSKVEAAKRPVDASGTATVPQKSMGASDLKNGNVMKRALERIARMAEA